MHLSPSHYGNAIRMFGPVMCYWTGRFESKHRVAKSTSESAKNVINVTKTIAERQQLRAASVFYNGMFNVSRFSLPEAVTLKDDIKDDSTFHNELKAFMSNDSLISSEIFVNNQTYKNGDLLALDVEDDFNITVGLIKSILVKNNKVYFVLKKYECVRKFLRYFESLKQYEHCIFKESSQLADFKPLIKRGTEGKFIFVLHHNISFVYK